MENIIKSITKHILFFLYQIFIGSFIFFIFYALNFKLNKGFNGFSDDNIKVTLIFIFIIGIILSTCAQVINYYLLKQIQITEFDWYELYTSSNEYMDIFAIFISTVVLLGISVDISMDSGDIGQQIAYIMVGANSSTIGFKLYSKFFI